MNILTTFQISERHTCFPQNEIWQFGFDDKRKPYTENRWPTTFAEINPADAARYGIENGDEIRMFSDDILIQVKGFNRVKDNEINFKWMV